MVENWSYYNHALIQHVPPHKTPDTSCLHESAFWNAPWGGRPLFAKWTTDFDCFDQLPWWYCIKDTPFSFTDVNAKRRYEINKGLKNFEVRQIDPRDYKERLFEVQVAAFSDYPEKYRPSVNKHAFLEDVESWHFRYITFGAFSKETGLLCGYNFIAFAESRCIRFLVQKTMPAYEKQGINAALVYGILDHYSDFLQAGGYICDGERSINHETAFQAYLEKYFGFRKAYCRLNIRYRPGFGWIVRFLYLFRKPLLKLDHIGIIHSVNAVLSMEHIRKECAKNGITANSSAVLTGKGQT